MKKIIRIIIMVMMLVFSLSSMVFAKGMEDPDFGVYMDKTCLTDPKDCTPGSIVEYQLQFYGTCTEFPGWEDALYHPRITDVLPEGLEFEGESSVEISGDKYDCYGVHTSQEGNTIKFNVVELGDVGDEYDCFITDELITLKYKCKINETTEVGTELTNTVTLVADGAEDPAEDSETITVVSNEVPAADEPEEIAEKSELDNVPKTGDESPIMWVVVAMTATLTTLTITLRCREREVEGGDQD